MLDAATLNTLGRKLRNEYARAPQDEMPDRLRKLVAEIERPRPSDG